MPVRGSIITDLNITLPNNTHCNDIDDIKRNWAKLSLNDILDLSAEINWGYSKSIENLIFTRTPELPYEIG